MSAFNRRYRRSRGAQTDSSCTRRLATRQQPLPTAMLLLLQYLNLMMQGMTVLWVRLLHRCDHGGERQLTSFVWQGRRNDQQHHSPSSERKEVKQGGAKITGMRKDGSIARQTATRATKGLQMQSGGAEPLYPDETGCSFAWRHPVHTASLPFL